MANNSCDVATNAQRLFALAQSRTLPIRKDFRIFPNAPPIDPGKLMFSEIMERFRESNREEHQEKATEATELELEEDDLSDIIYELITDLVEWNYGKNFNCHICALRHFNFGTSHLDEENTNSSGNSRLMSPEAIRYASYFLKNCVGACGYRHPRQNSPQPRPNTDDWEEFRLLK